MAEFPEVLPRALPLQSPAPEQPQPQSLSPSLLPMRG
jgi:hypothetical protein